MKKITIGVLASHLIALSIMNDAIILGDGAFFTWAKLLFLLSILLLIKGNLYVGKFKKADLFIIVFCLTSVVFSAAFSGGGIGIRFFSVATAFLIGCASYFMISRTILKHDELRKAFVFWVSISSLLSVFQSLTGFGYVSDRVFLSTIIPGLYRASGLMSDPNYFALICLLGIALSLGEKTSKVQHGLCILGLVLSGSRSGIVSYLAIVSLSRFKGKLGKGVFIKFIFVFFVFLFLAYFLREYLPESISMLFEIDSYFDESNRNSLSDRTLAISAGINAFISNPIFGYGIGNLTSHPLNFHGQMSHNTIVEILAENGVMGMFFYIVCNLYILKTINSSTTLNNQEKKRYVIMLVVLHVMSFTIVIHYSRILFFIFGLVALSARYRNDERF